MKIISQAPCRIGILGGGTDIPTYSDKFGGLCLNVAINIRQHFILTDSNGVENVYPKGANPKFYEEFYKEFNWEPETCISTFDGILESGLGSSASAAVALVSALSKYNKLNLTRSEIAERAWDIEVNKIGLFGGRQDQYAAAYGGVNLLEFSKEGTNLTRLDNFIEKVLPSFVLFYIGKNRKSANIQDGFKELTFSQEERLHKIKESVYEGAKIISSGDIEKFGRFLDSTWQLKKLSNKGVSNNEIDEIHDYVIKNGAFGFKQNGAGGGGHFMLVLDPDRKQNMIDKLEAKGIKHVDFGICYNGVETRIEK